LIKKRDMALSILNQIPNIKVFKPEGAFYILIDLVDVKLGSDAPVASGKLATHLLYHNNVAVVPGESFGAEHCLRISFASSIDAVTAAK